MRFRYQGQRKLLKDFVAFDKPLKSVSLLCEDGADLGNFYFLLRISRITTFSLQRNVVEKGKRYL